MDISKLIEKMTLQEKASLLSGDGWWKTKAIERLGIPSVYVADGPCGLRIQDEGEDNIYASRQAVCFPSAAGMAASFNRELLSKVGKTLAGECQNEMVDVILGPAVNIKRSPLCGRNFEYFSEDPYLAGQLASAYVKGVQEEGIGVAVKHFAANNQEKRRMCVSAVIDERAFREIYLAAFEEIVKSAKPDTVMCSYNKINGTYSSENPVLLDDILRKEWGFDGLVMSDWGAVSDRVRGAASGLDLEMPGSFGINEEKLIDAVEQGDLDEKCLDKAVERVLRLVDRYTGFIDLERERTGFDYIADHKMARKIARESMVLLKNDGALPLKKDENILFIGEFAKHPRIQGGGSSHVHCTKVFSPLKAAERVCKVSYTQGYSIKDDSENDRLRLLAIEKAKEADRVVIFAGLPESYEHEGGDREHMRLPKAQNKLIREIGCINPNTVVVLQNGSPVEMPWIKYVNAVLEAYLSGEAGSEAIVDLLFGLANPSGKLAETFPLRLEDNPSFANFPGDRLTVQYRESIFVGYRYYDKMKKDVLFPFGHGLSYSEFEYSDLNIEAGNKEAVVSFTVKNIGVYDGAEVAQIYVGKPVSNVFRPLRELKGFEKINLKAGEEKTVSVKLNSRAFSYYDIKLRDWYVEPGIYNICVGASSRDLRLSGNVCFEATDVIDAPYDADSLNIYFNGNPANATEDEYEILYGKKLPEKELKPGMKLTLENTLNDCKGTRWGGRIFALLSIIQNGRIFFGSEKTEMNIEMDMPIGALICMSSGRLTLKEGEAIIGLLNEENVGENLKILKDAVSSAMKKKSVKKKEEKQEKKEKKEAARESARAENEKIKADLKIKREKEKAEAREAREKEKAESKEASEKAKAESRNVSKFEIKKNELVGKTKEFIDSANRKIKNTADNIVPKAKALSEKVEDFINNVGHNRASDCDGGETSETSEKIKATDALEQSENTETTADIEESENTEAPADTEESENTEATENTENTQKSDSSDVIDVSEDI